MPSIHWANAIKKPLVNSVVFSKHAPPSDVGYNKYLSPIAQSVAVSTPKPLRINTVFTRVNTKPIVSPIVPNVHCGTIDSSANAEKQRKHSLCMKMMANRREKRASKRMKYEPLNEGVASRKTRKVTRRK